MGKGTDTVLLSLDRRLKLLEERLDRMEQSPLPKIRMLLDEFERAVRKHNGGPTTVYQEYDVNYVRQEICDYVDSLHYDLRYNDPRRCDRCKAYINCNCPDEY